MRWVPTQNSGVGHVHFMFFVLISFALASQREPSFQWNMGFSDRALTGPFVFHVVGKNITAKESMGHLKAQKDGRNTSLLIWATDYRKEANSHQEKLKDIVFFWEKDCIVGKCLLGQFHLENSSARKIPHGQKDPFCWTWKSLGF